jgi:hypothetical protein
MSDQLNIHEYHKASFSQFDIQTLQMIPLKELKLEKIAISRPDLEIIQSMETIESLVFLDCGFQEGLSLFPPNLKVLKITSTFGRGFDC